jgi:hypothetical protein
MEDDLFTRSNYRRNTRGRESLFGWTVAILLVLGLVLACWIGSFYVFGHPEQPKSYEILKKLGKITPPKRFELTAAPPGEFLTADQVYSRYSAMSDVELKLKNAEYLRSYIRNYANQFEKIPYVVGTFNILDSFELRQKDIITSGAVALAQSTQNPAVLIEHIYSCDTEIVPVLRRLLMTGLDIKLERTGVHTGGDLSTILHVEKLGDGRLVVTLVPLLYGTYSMAQGSGTFSLEPPDDLNVAAGFPIIKGEDFLDAENRYAAYRKKAGVEKSSVLLKPTPKQKDAQETPAPRSTPALARATPTPAPAPTVDPATALAILKRSGALSEAASPSPAPTVKPAVAMATPSPTPGATPVATPVHEPIAAATPAVTPVPVQTPVAEAAPPGVDLKPFLVSSPPPNTVTTQAAGWKTYAPGQMPRGRLVSPREAPELAETGVGDQPIYLQGEFTVTTSSRNSAVLRPRSGLAGTVANLARGGSGQIRVIVEYPPDMTPPGQGATVSRGSSRPFRITRVSRGDEGWINVFAQEITKP